MQVIIPIAKLEAQGACLVYLDSPEWDKGQKELVYADWSKTVIRLLSTPAGTGYLSWLVAHELVPMTKSEFSAAREKQGQGTVRFERGGKP